MSTTCRQKVGFVCVVNETPSHAERSQKMGDPGTAAAVADPKKKQTASQEEAAVVESTIDTVKSEQEAGDDEDDDDDDDDLMDMEFPTVPTIAGPSVKRQKPDSTTTWDNNAICHVLDLSIKSYDGASVPLWQAPKDESSSSSWDPKPLALPPWAAAEQF